MDRVVVLTFDFVVIERGFGLSNKRRGDVRRRQLVVRKHHDIPF